MKTFMLGIVVALCALAGGCSTAGPFVTDVWNDGNGNLVIEKNTLRMMPLMRRIRNGNNPTRERVSLAPARATN